MIALAKETLGIVVSDEKVFVTCLKKTDGKFKVARAVSVELPEGLVRNGLVTDTKKFAGILKDFLKAEGIAPGEASVCALAAPVITKEARVPVLAEEKVREVLKGELTKYMLTGEPAEMDYYRIDKDRVFMVAIRKDVADSLLDGLDRSGLNLTSIDIIPLAVLRALSEGNVDLSAKKSVILVLVGSHETEISIVKDGFPSYSRSISSFDAEEMVKEIVFTSTYWDEQSPEEPVEKIVVSGDTSAAKNLNLGLSRVFHTVEQGMPLGEPVTDYNLTRSAAIGAAMRGARSGGKFDINLLPVRKVKRLMAEKIFLKAFISTAFLLTLFFAANMVFTTILRIYDGRLGGARVRLAASPQVLGELEKLNEERFSILDRLNRKRGFIKKVELVPWTYVLTDIRSCMPSDVWLTGISETSEGTTLIIKGRSLSQDSVYRYVDLLALSGCLDGPKLDFLGDLEDGGRTLYEFRIKSSLLTIGALDEAG